MERSAVASNAAIVGATGAGVGCAAVLLSRTLALSRSVRLASLPTEAVDATIEESHAGSSPPSPRLACETVLLVSPDCRAATLARSPRGAGGAVRKRATSALYDTPSPATSMAAHEHEHAGE